MATPQSSDGWKIGHVGDDGYSIAAVRELDGLCVIVVSDTPEATLERALADLTVEQVAPIDRPAITPNPPLPGQGTDLVP